MPYRPWEEATPDSELPPPSTPTKSAGNDGASHADPDAEDPDRGSDEEEELGAKKIRPPRHVLTYEVVKRWVTGEKALQSSATIHAELEELCREFMELSGQRKFFGHKQKETDLGGWKLGRSHTNKRGVRFDVYRCPLRDRTGCQNSMRVVIAPDFIELQRYGLHDRHSHDNDRSKKLKYDQIISVVEAAKTAPTLSGATLRRNLCDHNSPTKTIPVELKRCVQRRVYNVRKELTKQHVDGFELDDSFGALTAFCEDNLFSTLLRKHNDAEDPYHLRLYDFVVLGSQVAAEHDVVRITFGSVWMLCNAFRAIIAGWVFQLNGDVTGKFCNKTVDLVEFSVTSIPKQNNILCLGVIPKGSESEVMYKITWDDFRKALVAMKGYKYCGKEGCECCIMVEEILEDEEVQSYFKTDKFAESKLPVQTAMCDNFKGWGNFSENELGIVSNVCHPHASGNVLSTFYLFCDADVGCMAGIAADQHSHVKQFPAIEAYDDYYDLIVAIGEIGVESFATRVQELLVAYLRETYGDGPANWCFNFWTGDRGRMCLAHARYAGCNNNMGVEVSWKNIKEICSYLSSLATFIGALCKFIRNQLGEEHMYRMMRDGGHSNHFIREPQETREMYDAVQAMHPKTLSACFILTTSTGKRNPEIIYRDMMEQVMESGRARTPLHLKVLAYHNDRIAQREQLPLELHELKSVLMPRQWWLRKLDPDGLLTVPELRQKLEPHVRMYKAVVLRIGHEPPDLDVKQALRIYQKFHLISQQSTWGRIPISCSCKVCFPNCVCEDTIMFAALFNPKVRVPADQVTATVSKRQVQKPIGGAAGYKRRRLIAERACNEKAVSSKVKYLKASIEEEPQSPSSPPSPQWVVPEALSPAPSEDDDFEVHTPVESDARPD
jgi:hypothetical protein